MMREKNECFFFSLSLSLTQKTSKYFAFPVNLPKLGILDIITTFVR